MLPLQSWANSSNIFMGWLLTQKMVLSLKCVQDNEPRCFPASLPRINLYWRDLLKHSDSAAFPTVLCCDSLRIHCGKRQTCCMWRWAWGLRQVQGSWRNNRVLWPVLAGPGNLCWNLWCAKFTWPDQIELSVLKLLRISFFFSKA